MDNQIPDDFVTPDQQRERARLLINTWAVANGRPCPWAKAVKIMGVICGLSPEDQTRLIELDYE